MVDELIAGFKAKWQPSFPSPADASAAVGEFSALESWGIGAPDRRDATGHEGPRHQVAVAAGCVGIASVDRGRRDRTLERQQLGGLDARSLELQARAAMDEWLTARCGVCEGLRCEHTVPCESDGYIPFPGLNPDAVAEIRAVMEGIDLPERARRGVILEWSAKSRARMVRTLCEIDFGPMFADESRMPAMLTFTYPGDWETVAPCGDAAKAHLDALMKRYEREWEELFYCVWKLEFQRRGAPHFHLLFVPPHGEVESGEFDENGDPEKLNFRQWLSRTWAEIVDHPDPEEFRRHQLAGTAIDYSEGLKASDPKRVAVYFTKHASFADKEYQHIVPEAWQVDGKGPGRFWGKRRLVRVREVREIPADVYDQLAHVLRKHQRAQKRVSTRRVPRCAGGLATPKYQDVLGVAALPYLQPQKVKRRKLNRRVKLYGRHGAGWTAVNDGPRFARQLAAWVHRDRDDDAHLVDENGVLLDGSDGSAVYVNGVTACRHDGISSERN